MEGRDILKSTITMRIIHFELVKILGKKTFRVQVESLDFRKKEGGIVEIWATPRGGKPMLVDEETVYLFQSTNAFDKHSRLIFHGDILKGNDGTLYEVFYANGSFFIVGGNGEPLMLFDEVVRRVEVVGDVIRNYDLVAQKIDESIFIKEGADK